MASLGYLLLLLCLPLDAHAIGRPRPQNPISPRVEIVIPRGMPIKFEAMREQSDYPMTKYTFKRIVPKGARKAKIITLMIDNAGAVKHVSDRVIAELRDPMEIATVDKSVCRILVIVEWLETDGGKWVLDTKTPERDIEMMVKDGVKVVPRSKFIRK